MSDTIQVDKNGKLGQNPFTDKFQHTIVTQTLHAQRIKTDWSCIVGEPIFMYQRFTKKDELKRLKSSKRIHWIKNRRFFKKGMINKLRNDWRMNNLHNGIYKVKNLS